MNNRQYSQYLSTFNFSKIYFNIYLEMCTIIDGGGKYVYPNQMLFSDSTDNSKKPAKDTKSERINLFR